jgi:hypothetical protein
MLHAFDGTGLTQLPYNVTVDLTPDASITLVDGYSSYSAKVNPGGTRFLLSVDLEVIFDGVSYSFDYGQTTFVDKSSLLDKSLSTVSTMSSTSATSSIPGAKGKSGSRAAPHGPHFVGFLVALAAIMMVL